MKKTDKKKKLQSCELYVDGMHCAACELTIEKRLSKFEGIKSVDADLARGKVKIIGNIEESKEDLAEQLSNLVKNDGYSIHAEKTFQKKKVSWSDYYYAAPIALIVILTLILLQKFDILATDVGASNYLGIFFIGLTASLSSCMAVVGGLVLSLSANIAKESKATKFSSQVSFHIGRLVGFFFLGGLVGILGKSIDQTKILFKVNSEFLGFDINFFITVAFVLNILVAIVLILLAFNLLEIFGFTKRFQLKMPKFISNKFLKVENLHNKESGNLAKILVAALTGVITFFLPCGFTNSIQLEALRSGNFKDGAMIMLVFALGTLPVLALVSFLSSNFNKGKKSEIFFKIAGIIVLYFAIKTIIGALISAGILGIGWSI